MKALHTRSKWALTLILFLLILSLAGCTAIVSDVELVATQMKAEVTGTPTAVPVTVPAATALAPATVTPPTAAPVATAAITATTPGTSNAGTADQMSLATAVRTVAEIVKPAVVQITNEQTQFDLYNQPYTVPAGVGSGVIYDAQGHILTNDHVVEGAQQLIVSLPDGRSFQAKLVGADPQTDLAVLQIKGSNLPVAQLGDSHQLQVGDWVVAIGNALALSGGPTVTVGVVSALGRTVQEPGGFTTQGPYLFDAIQTSAPINPGNSGGPLVTLSGQVVGINTLVAGQAEPGVQAQGIGFAIAINSAKPIADQLVATGKVVHPSLGILYVALNPAIAAQLGINQTTGVVVVRVISGSLATAAGLRRGDVITAVDNVPIPDDSALAQIVNQHKPGDILTLTVLRGGQTLTIKVTLDQASTA